jgi:CheY-like chemotaxis protein
MARVLLVEDDPQTRELTTLRLQVDGHHVLTAADTAAVQPDLVAVNVLHRDAAEIVAALRDNESTRRLPIVTYLAYASSIAVQELSLGDAEPAQGQPLLRLLSVMNTLNQPAYAPAN